MSKANSDIRKKAKTAGVFLYQIADFLGISEPTLTRKLRRELAEQDKETFFNAIDSIKAQQEAGAAV